MNIKKIDSVDFVLRFAFIFYVLMFIGLTSCSIEEDILILEEPTLELNGQLPMDSNGYYHLELNQNTNQTIHTVTGTVGNTLNINEPLKVSWDSNLTWSYHGEDVSTSNQASYVMGGKVYNVIGPVKTMAGDTLILTGTIREYLITDSIMIVLE
jgi:hypothetical protein